MPPTKLTPEEQVRLIIEALKKAKLSAKASGRDMPWPEVEAVILPFLRPRQLDKSDNPFGFSSKIPPRPEWVTAYSASIGYPMNGAGWCDSYAQKDWHVGKRRMQNWHAAVRNWKTNKWGQGGIALSNPAGEAGKDYRKL